MQFYIEANATILAPEQPLDWTNGLTAYAFIYGHHPTPTPSFLCKLNIIVQLKTWPTFSWLVEGRLTEEVYHGGKNILKKTIA